MIRFSRSAAALRFDASARSVCIGGRKTALQHKVWAVLTAIVEAAPGAVTRARLIEDIWDGRYATGEKALNQALWAIRAALSDDAKAPRLIATIPRQGYQWIGPEPRYIRDEDALLHKITAAAAAFRAHRLAAVVAGVLAVSYAVAGLDAASDPTRNADALAAEIPAPGQTSAYFEGRNIIVKFDRTKLIIKPSGEKHFGEPLLSTDGRQVAFHVEEPDQCKLVMIDLPSLEKAEFGRCDLLEHSAATSAKFRGVV